MSENLSDILYIDSLKFLGQIYSFSSKQLTLVKYLESEYLNLDHLTYVVSSKLKFDSLISDIPDNFSVSKKKKDLRGTSIVIDLPINIEFREKNFNLIEVLNPNISDKDIEGYNSIGFTLNSPIYHYLAKNSDCKISQFDKDRAEMKISLAEGLSISLNLYERSLIEKI